MKLTTTKTKTLAETAVYQIFTKAIYGYEEKNLWLLSGGSNISHQVTSAKRMASEIGANTAVALADEHFHDYDHPDTNARKLKDAGFPFVQFYDRAEIILKENPPIAQAAELYSHHLQSFAKNSNIVMNLGFGVDMHVAGLMPVISRASISYQDDVVIAYQEGNLQRISVTEQFISTAHTIILYGAGKQKQRTIELASKNTEAPLHRIMNLPQTHLIISESDE